MATVKVSSKVKFAIADAIASSYDVDLTNVSKGTAQYSYYFAQVINNACFTTKSGIVHTLKSYCKSEDDAMHITNLVLRRLAQPQFVQRTVAQLS